YAGSDAGLRITSYNEYNNGAPLTFVNRGTLSFTGVSTPENDAPTALIEAGDYNASFVNDTGGTINLSGEAQFGIRASGAGSADNAHG
ncbi:hypothetical protein, partial [Klebsiella oxytoca]